MTFRSLLGGDFDAIQALEPEELAGHVLADLIRLEKACDRHNMNRHNYAEQGIAPTQPAKLAVLEACSYLEGQGLIATMTREQMFVTRRGHKVADQVGLRKLQQVRLPETLHPAILQRASAPFIRAEYEVAVFQAYKEVEIQVRNAAGFSADVIGEKLMRNAFDPKKGPLTDKDAPVGERAALQNLFAGAFGYFRNPPGHRDVGTNDPVEAIEMIGLASHLVRIVEARRPLP